MSNEAYLDLSNYINRNLPWVNLKKRPRSVSRYQKKSTGGNLKMSFDCNISKKVECSSVFEPEKLGVAVLGEQFTENVNDVPIKKRRCLRQLSSSSPGTPSLNSEAFLSPENSTPSSNCEMFEQFVPSKSVSGQMSCSKSYTKKRANKKNNGLGAHGTMSTKKNELLKTSEFFLPQDLSGIALLAAAASIEDKTDHIELSAVEEVATPEIKDVSRATMKENVTASESEGSSVSENALLVGQSLHCDNENDTGVKTSVPSKVSRLHWDLNKTMDEWEEPSFSPQPNTQATCTEGIVDGVLQFQHLKKVGCEVRDFDDMGHEIENLASDAEITSKKPDMVDHFSPPTSSASSVVGEDEVIRDSRVQVVVQGSAKEVDQGGVVYQKTSKVLDDVKLASANPPNYCNGSEYCQDEQRHPADGDNMMRVEEGYDSPYEDGEVREPLVNAWEEKVVENWENECVDFEFDDEYEDGFDTDDHAISESFIVDHVDNQVLLETSSLKGENIDVVAGEKVQLVKDVSNEEEKVFNKTMVHKEGFLPFDDLHRRGAAYLKRRSFDDVGKSYSRTERVFGSEKKMGRDRPPFQGRARNEVDYRWVDSAEGDWDMRNKYGYTRSRNVISDSDGKWIGPKSHDQSQSRGYGPRGVSRPLNRRQTPEGKNEFHPLYRKTQPMQGFSREGSRGRSGFIPQGFRTGPREKYHEPGPYYSERKERGFSPNINRDSRVPRICKRSRSRSRSMSPIIWNKRNTSTRQHSPDFRIESRVEEERYPLQKPTFPGDFHKGFTPQRNSRSFHDDRKCMDGPYKYKERCPQSIRMLRENPRFDSGGYPENLKSGDYSRPMIRPLGRFQHGGGPCNFDQSREDRRKPEDERYEGMHRGRNYDRVAGASLKRFKYYVDADCFEPRDARKEDKGFRGRS